MEAHLCDTNHLDADVLLPPRKRLLAGLKKQNSDLYSYMPSNSSFPNEYDERINKLLNSHLNSSSLAEEEIVEASRLAAETAVKVAQAARGVANEKAIIAAKAMAVAKNALDLVVNLSDETFSNGEYLKKDKMKKQVGIQLLYNSNDKKLRAGNSGTDGELARTLHRVTNSSPRISKNPLPSEKGPKHKRLKSLAFSEMNPDSNPSTSNENVFVAGEVDGGSLNEKETNMVKVNGTTSTFNKVDSSKMENGEIERLHLNEKYREEDGGSLGRKRGRMKQKKLPLSICNFRDQVKPKAEVKYRSSKMSEEDAGIASDAKKPFFKVGPSSNSVMPVERSTSLWKCQSFKAPACVKQNKVVKS